MKFEDISARRISVRVKPKDFADTLKTGDILSLKMTPIRGEFAVRIEDAIVTVRTDSAADANVLTDVLSAGRSTLARLSDPAPDNSAMLEIALFNGEVLEMGSVEVGVDEKVISAIGKHQLDETIRVLQRQSVFEHGGQAYFFLVAGGASDRYLESADAQRNFAIVGTDYSFALAEKDRGDGEMIFFASRVHRIRNRHEDTALRIAHGSLKFLDWTVAGERALLAKAQIDRLTQEGGSYLRKWDEFGNAEGDVFLEQARSVGAIRFSIKSEQQGGHVVLQCGEMTDVQKTGLASAKEVDIVKADELPIFLNNPEMSFAEFSSNIALKDSEDSVSDADARSSKGGCSKREPKPKESANGLSVEWFNPATRELCLSADITPEGDYIILSVAGDVAQIKRRMKARVAIQNARAANPNLGLLIEDGASIPPSPPPPKLKPLTAAVRRKVFPKNPPTVVQEKAIEIALNTPDIALIQGPPGTGKTTVIAAIIERLNEEFDKRGDLSGHVLLTGFQHDAVENMIERLSINGLPVPKFGQRSGEQKDAAFSRFERQLQEWCDARALELRAKNPQIKESLDEQKLRSLCVQYINAPTLALALSLLEQALTLPDRTLGESLRKRLQLELRRLQTEDRNSQTTNPKLPLVRALRVTESGFADDGADRAGDALVALKDELEESDRELLVSASRWLDKNVAPPFLKELKMLKGRLLMRFTPAPMFRTEKPRDSVVDLIRETIGRVRLHGLSMRDKRTAALSELLLEMESNPAGIQDAVTDYCFAFAATCQQSVNRTMQRLKGIVADAIDENQKMQYDYVIVDEAARVSPRDLMIAMVQGKRIILVGDHRQLPQLIDEDLARKFEADQDCKDENDWLKKSLFEYLFTERVRKLEAMDGRPRHITLDAQFRTHPLLGEFISRNFYERFNDNEKFESPLKDEGCFAHGLPGIEGKCAIWLDVPKTAGTMTRPDNGTSWVRSSEAKVICEKLKSWIEFDTRKVLESSNADIMPLSFGVISFYKAQTDLIKKGFGKEWLKSYEAQTDEIKQKLGEKWAESEVKERLEVENRLKIGTVDSFQGREFDVVFLSLVRTGKTGFGFLKLYNRLNVSMSRQKKLLVVVGDAAFYDTDAARKNVPGLADFLSLCREKGAVL